MDFASLSPETVDEEASDYEESLPPPPPTKKGKKGASSSSNSKGKGRAAASASTSKGQASTSNTAAAGESGAASASTSKQSNPAALQEDEGVAHQRKIQNRVAQREFRQRKLQYVKDLEARVEFLSSSKDDQLEALKAMLRGLLEENKQLRILLQQVSGFIGKGLGGHSHELGFQDVQDWDEFVNRSDRDTLHRAHEGWKTRYAKNNKVEASPSASLVSGEASTGTPSHNPGPSSSAPGQAGRSNSISKQVGHGAHESSGSPSGQPQTNAGSTRQSPTTAINPPAFNRLQQTSAVTTNEYFAESSSSSSGHKRLRTGESASHSADALLQGGSSSGTTPSSQSGAVTSTSPAFLVPRNDASSSTASASGIDSLANYGGFAGFTSSAFASLPAANSNSSFFFDISTPLGMPASSFTSDFMQEFAHTGLTPGPTSDLSPPPMPQFPWQVQGGGYGISPDLSPASMQQQQQATSYPLPESHRPLSDQNASLSVSFHPSQSATSSSFGSDASGSSLLLRAISLISFHMRNKVANPSYALPPSLAPTTLQFMTPHDSRIDGIIWPSLRDRLITNVDYDLNNVLPDLLEAINVHMGDSKDSNLLDPVHWEISERFCQKYKSLITEEVVETSNRWRRARGQADLIF